MDFQEREDYIGKFYVVTFFQALKKPLLCFANSNCLIFTETQRYVEFKSIKI